MLYGRHNLTVCLITTDVQLLRKIESYPTSGIRADEAERPQTIILIDTHFRVWSTLTEQMLREKKVQGHITRTANLFTPVRIIFRAIKTHEERLNARNKNKY